jgi:hypothetical protein
MTRVPIQRQKAIEQGGLFVKSLLRSQVVWHGSYKRFLRSGWNHILTLANFEFFSTSFDKSRPKKLCFASSLDF